MEEEKRRAAIRLVKRLSNATSSSSSLASAISEIRTVTKLDPSIRIPLADSGAIPLLINHLLSIPPISSPSSQENASASLLNLSISARESVMSTPGLLHSLSHSLRPSSPPPVAQNSAATIFSLLSLDSYRPIIGSNKPLLSALIALLRTPNQPSRTLKDALKALFGVALYPMNRARMVELGAVQALFAVVGREGRGGVVEDATAVIAQVAGCYECLEAFRRVAGFRVLVEMMEEGKKGRVRENAAAALVNVAMSGGDAAVGEIREVEGAEEVVREMVAAGISDRADKKAVALLRLLESGRRCWGGGDGCWIGDLEMDKPPSTPLWYSSGDSSASY